MPYSPDVSVSIIKSIDSVPHILKLVAESTGVGFVCIAHVTPDSWTVCAIHDEVDFGLTVGGKLDVTYTLCNSVRAMDKEIVIEHADEDPLYADHPVPKMFNFQSYFSFPLHDEQGRFFGTLCGLDKKALALNNDKVLSLLSSFSALITRQIEYAAAFSEAKYQWQHQKDAVQLREQNIAILGHDLRTPLSTISVGLDVIENITNEPQTAKVVKMMRASAFRIERLISDVMDFAHTRASQGVIVQRRKTDELGDKLSHVVAELSNNYPAATITGDIVINDVIYCDPDRLSQLLSNLLINALIHGEDGRPVTVSAQAKKSMLCIQVANYGPTIPAEAIDRLFQPFWRQEAGRESEGLGLGLYIASEISKAHDAKLFVSSESSHTVFSFHMPVLPASDH